MVEDNRIYSYNVLDSNFDELFFSKCKFLEKKYNEIDLKKLCYKDVLLMGDFLINLKPKSHAREHKKTMLKYLDFYIDYNKPLSFNKKLIHKNVRDYLMKISKFLEKYDFTNAVVYNIILVVVTFVELLIIYILSMTYYMFPYFSIFLFFYFLNSKNNLRKKGKLLDL